MGQATNLFLAAKAAQGASPRTIEWHRMITTRLVRALGAERAVDGLDPAELRAGLVELRTIWSARDRAIVLLMIDTGLRVSEVAALRLGDLRPDGTLKVHGKGSKERIVPVGSTARQAIVRYLGQRGPGLSDEGLSLGRRGELGPRGIAQLLRRLKTRIG